MVSKDVRHGAKGASFADSLLAVAGAGSVVFLRYRDQMKRARATARRGSRIVHTGLGPVEVRAEGRGLCLSVDPWRGRRPRPGPGRRRGFSWRRLSHHRAVALRLSAHAAAEGFIGGGAGRRACRALVSAPHSQGDRGRGFGGRALGGGTGHPPSADGRGSDPGGAGYLFTHQPRRGRSPVRRAGSPCGWSMRGRISPGGCWKRPRRCCLSVSRAFTPR